MTADECHAPGLAREDIGLLWIALAGLALALAVNARSARGDEAPAPAREPGVRLRLYSTGVPMHRFVRLAGEASPNVDRTIGGLVIVGDEPWLDEYPGRYVARLETHLNLAADGDYAFELASAALAELSIDGELIAATDRTQPAVRATAALSAGQHAVLVQQVVSDDPHGLAVRWAPRSGFLSAIPLTSIPASVLSAEAFVFRPTQPGTKRLQDEADRPGRGMPVAGLYPGLDLATLHTAEFEAPVGGLDVLPDGRLVVARFDARRLRAPRPQEEPDGELWLLSGVGGPVEQVTRERIATGLFEPAGVAVVGGAIYVSQRSEVTRFDFKAAEHAWRPTTIASGWETNDFHAISFGLVHQSGPVGHPGYLYMARGTGLGLFRNPPNHGSVWRIDLSKPNGQNVEAITGGHRTPNGIGVGPEGALFVTDNQGEYTPANELNHVQDGKFYGFVHKTDGDGAAPTPFQPADATAPGAVTEAAVWLPQDEIGNSPSEPILIPEGWPFAGQMLVGDVKYGGVTRVSLQQVGGVWQGAAYRFTQGLVGGTNRLAFAADGSLFVGCIGGDHASTWNWVNPHGEKTYQGLQRLRPNRRLPLDLREVTLTADGLRVEFTKPVPEAWLSDPANFAVTQWTYRATPEYGGPKIDEERLVVRAARPAIDRLAVELEIEGVKADRVVHLLADARADDGEEIWSAEAWYTVRRLMAEEGPKKD
jgi:glucose/arabinose dehydrogenase